MYKSKNAFTMIEMVFVIVVLGILAAIAVPRMAATRTDADITKGRSDIASIRSSILTERQGRIIQGCSAFIPVGTGTYGCNGNTYNNLNEGGLFGGVLMYPPVNQSGVNGKWSSADTGTGTYVFRVNNVNVTFTYTPANGRFTCDTTHATYGTTCATLIN